MAVKNIEGKIYIIAITLIPLGLFIYGLFAQELLFGYGGESRMGARSSSTKVAYSFDQWQYWWAMACYLCGASAGIFCMVRDLIGRLDPRNTLIMYVLLTPFAAIFFAFIPPYVFFRLGIG